MVSNLNGFQVRVVDGRYAELLRSLREGDIDCLIGALRHPTPADDVQQEILFSDALCIVAHPRHPLAGKSNLKLEDTLTYPWIAPPAETPAGQYLFDTLRIQDRPETPVRAVSSSMAILRGVLAEGAYVSIVSRHQIQIDEQLGSIAALDVPLTGHIRNIGLTYRVGWRPTKTQAQFIEHLRKFSVLGGVR
jgi:DNA-binding transcriptional LysR family regulator